MKKAVKILTVFLSLVFVFTTMFALSVSAEKSTTMAFSSNSLNVGDKLTVTIRFSASETMYAVSGTLNYDSSVLKYESGEDANSGGADTVLIAGSANGQTKSVKLTFTAKKAGTSNIALLNPVYVGDIENKMSGCSANVTVKDKNAVQSSNANLKSLWISAGTLSPAFSPSTTSYTIKIPNDKTVLTVSATPADSTATVSVQGSKEMKVGKNKRVVKVTAANGTVKEYTLNISRLDASGNEVTTEEDKPTTPEELKVVVDGNPMIIADNFPTENLPTGFTVAAYKYKEKEVSSISDGKQTLLYLTDEAGEKGAFYEVTEDGSFVKFIYIQNAVNTYVILTPESEEIPLGYTAFETTIGSTTVTAYRNEEESVTDFVLIYAKGVDGNIGWYRYDTVEKSLQRAVGFTLETEPKEEEPTTLLGKVENFSDNEKIAAITIVAVILLLIAALIVLIVKIATFGKAAKEETEEDLEEDFDTFETVNITNRDQD